MEPLRAEADLVSYSSEPLEDEISLDDDKLKLQADIQLVERLTSLEKELIEANKRARKSDFDKIVTRTLAIAFAIGAASLAVLYGTESRISKNLIAQQERILRRANETVNELNRTKHERDKAIGERDTIKQERDQTRSQLDKAQTSIKLYSDYVGRTNKCHQINDCNKRVNCRSKAVKQFHKEKK